MPLLAFDAARKSGIQIDEQFLKSQAEFTHTSFQAKLEQLKAGDGIGGRTLTVAYGLWALDLAQWKSDEVTTAMVTYLLKTQEADGHWPRHSLRPPLSESLVTATVIAADFSRKYATESQREQAEAATGRARAWLDKTELQSQEDHVVRLWGLKLLGGDEGQLSAARDQVTARQRPDGGWSQATGMQSDAYATGQTLFVLRETGVPREAAEYQKGMKFLLDTQQADGSWLVETRATPVQVFFDNGDPPGKHQFISLSATAWAVAALAR